MLHGQTTLNLACPGVVLSAFGNPVRWRGIVRNRTTLHSHRQKLNLMLYPTGFKKVLEPSEFNVDNQGLLEKIKNFDLNSKTKHLDIKMKWLRELKDSNQINVKLIPSEEMVADALTKASNANSLKRLQERCFLVPFSPS
ncbi:hypothetical protein VP01_2783g4 [Puccinia sorghi]|uniref:Uncharacterized protein n=1 Tax=Puccinia sorghi TaxID=27349 RepID=A0A0L6V2P5_9BASI|nr:hypothetical protein VP01_2783g4 [Puccinia sorghi]